MQKNLLEVAFHYLDSGLSFMPISTDGKRIPRCKWKPLQKRLPTDEDIDGWYGIGSPKYGISIITGEVSGGLENIDFDDMGVYKPWQNRVNELMPGLCEKLVVVQSPRPGRHLYYRCNEIEENQKLAERFDEDEKRVKTMIETKSEGGSVVAPGSPASCHKTGRLYTFLGGKTFANLQRITPEERNVLLAAARQLNEYVGPTPPRDYRPQQQSLLAFGRPGDDFNAKANWADILEPHGWSLVHTNDRELHWERPGKNEGTTSATTNFHGNDQLYVFSTNAEPFEAERGYSKFHAFTLLNHAGDFQQAAKALRAQGYGNLLSPLVEVGARNGEPLSHPKPKRKSRILS